MRGPKRWLALSGLALAVWASDRWLWMVPGLVGVAGGVWMARWQRHRDRRPLGMGASAIGPLLVNLLLTTSCLYIYLVFLLLSFERATGRLSWAFATGAVGLTVVLVGLSALLLRRLRSPSWWSKVWDWLLEER